MYRTWMSKEWLRVNLCLKMRCATKRDLQIRKPLVVGLEVLSDTTFPAKKSLLTTFLSAVVDNAATLLSAFEFFAHSQSRLHFRFGYV